MDALFDYFKRQADGSWLLIRPLGAAYGGAALGLESGILFRSGDRFMGIDVVAELEVVALLRS